MSEEEYVRASLNTEEKEDSIFNSQDPFNKRTCYSFKENINRRKYPINQI